MKPCPQVGGNSENKDEPEEEEEPEEEGKSEEASGKGWFRLCGSRRGSHSRHLSSGDAREEDEIDEIRRDKVMLWEDGQNHPYPDFM